MLKGWMHDIALAVQAKSGATPAVFVWIAVLAIALLTAFVFLCVAAFMWLSLQFGGVVAGLIMAGVFASHRSDIGDHLLIGAASRQGARNPRTCRAGARVVMAARSRRFLLPHCRSAARSAGSASYRLRCSDFIAAQWVREYRAREGDNQQS